MSKNFHHNQKIVKHFLLKILCCHTASYTIQLVTTGNGVNFYLAFALDKTHHGAVIAPFFVLILKFPLHFF